MAKGIIYVMTTVVPGLIKIGKTGTSNFESRMYQLERHGYSNVVGLKRHFAIGKLCTMELFIKESIPISVISIPTSAIVGSKFIVLKGSVCCPIRGAGWTSTKQIDQKRDASSFIDDVLQEDVEFTSPSLAAAFLTYKPENGWTEWKTADGKPIDVFRK